QYQDTRWISAPEACWRIFGFDMLRINPSVLHLQIHLPKYQTVMFLETSNLKNILADEQNKKTMLTEYFEMNKVDPSACNFTYREFPRYYVWNNTTKKWTKRCQGQVIGRIYTVNPNEGERYYLRLLLNNVKGANALKRKLIEPEQIYHHTMHETAQYQMPSALCQLFTMILLFGEPNDVRSLWNISYTAMSEDFSIRGIPDSYPRINAIFLHIKYLLEQHHKSLNDYDLPLLMLPNNISNELPRLIINELN
ncbi:8893_t:CDS:2, partial [Cetraspora pellucida]